MTLNHDLIRGKSLEIEESLGRLEKIGKKPKEEFLKDQDLMDVASYRVLVAIEAALGLCYHVCAVRLKKVPEDYAGCFALLAEAGIIPATLSEKLQKTARFRNLLIHMYWKVDYEQLYAKVKEFTFLTLNFYSFPPAV